MKAYQKDDNFKNVIIELESQDELDKFFAILNFTAIIEALEMVNQARRIRDDISEYKKNAQRWHDKISDAI